MPPLSFIPIPKDAPLEDIAVLHAMARDTFVETFGANYPPEDLKTYLDERLSLQAIKTELAEDNAYFYFIEAAGKRVGYFKYLTPCTMYLNDGEKARYKAPFCLERLYMLQGHQRQGLAAVAMQYMIALARNTYHCDWLYLSVWSENYNAQRFYQRFGFTTVRSFKYPVGNTDDLELIYGLTL